MKAKRRILILCTGNSCRSQMAEGYLHNFTAGKITIVSAGLEAHGLNPLAVRVMQEDGIDITGHTSNRVDEYLGTHFDLIITVCDHAKEQCPYFPDDTVRMHYPIQDPANARGTEAEKLVVYRTVRDEIREFCRVFAYEQLP